MSKTNPTLADLCVCSSKSCFYCTGSTDPNCLSSEVAKFVDHVFAAYSLPLTTEDSVNNICYRYQLPTAACTKTFIEGITGVISGYGTPAVLFTPQQCYKLLKEQWTPTSYWFTTLFPTFTRPTGATDTELTTIKSILHLWILQFGSAEVGTWTDIKAAANGAAGNWQNYIGWIDIAPGFSLDAGATRKDFPATLLAWLTTYCNNSSFICKELALFNLKSTVCANPACLVGTTKGYCGQIAPNSACATRV